MLKIKNKEQPNRAVLLSNVDEDEEFSINNIEKQQKPLSSDNIENQQKPTETTKPLKICSINFTWKCMCLASILTTLITIIIILIVIFTYILPHIAQNTINYATMDIINGTMYNPTNSTITLNATIQVSNTGMFSGIIPPITSTVSNDNIKIGTMKMPQIKTVANQPTIISITTVLYVTNSTQFKKSTKQLMQNIDQIWKISANNLKISVGILRFTVNLNKDLRLPGIHLYDFVASNFDANSATNVSINAISDLDFVSDTILTLILPMILLQMYTNNVYIGYVVMNNLTIKRGHNIIKNQQIVVDSNGINNGDEISKFLSEYVQNHNQNITIVGPYARQINGKNYKPLIIDGIMEQTTLALGYSFGSLAFGSTLTSETQSGWSVDGAKYKVRGAYANLINPFNVTLKIVNLSGDAYLKYPIGYTVKMVPFDEFKCPITNKFAHLYIGRGIYKNNASKTWVDVPANGKQTFFTIAEPMNGTNALKHTCFGMPFSCCFATLAPGYICKLNNISKHTDDELKVGFMSMELYSNITVLIDNKFNITMRYNQPFFPVYFGYQVYSGYIGDAEIKCSDYTFY
eukprot:286986_1